MNAKTFAFALGRPFSPLYSLAMRLREASYRRGLFRSYRFEVPVISVGNLTLGGTGKTPMVQWMARLLQSRGYCPAVISRGYGGTANAKVNLVSDGTTLLLDALAAGDEPRLLAETLPGVPVLTGIVRRLPAQRAVSMGADVLLIDDGFQHLPIVRDVNLALFNADRLAGNSRVFPGGDLREPVAALHRATRFVLTGVHEANLDRATRFVELLRTKFPAIPVSQTGYHVDRLVMLSATGMIEPLADGDVPQEPCFGFCGIAHPDSFRRTAVGLNVRLANFLPLEDHQRYSERIVEHLLGAAQRSGAGCLLTTEKDLVKLTAVAAALPLPLYAVRMRVEAGLDLAEDILNVVRMRTESTTLSSRH